MANPKLAVVGSANIDLVFEAARFPEPGQTIIGHGFQVFSGGKGANQAVAAARLGADVEFIGKVGDDEFAKIARGSLHASHVGISRLLTAEAAPTGTAGIVVADGGENSIVVNSGANGHLYPDEVQDALDAIKPAYVLTQFEIPPESSAACAGWGKLQVNPAPARGIEEGFFSKIDLLAPNRSEIRDLTGLDPVDSATCALACRTLLKAGVKAVVLTLGSDGCFVATSSFFQHLPTISVKPVDTTGAGDTFNGALAAFLLEGRDLINAALLALAAASISTTRHGAQASMPTLKELRSAVGDLF